MADDPNFWGLNPDGFYRHVSSKPFTHSLVVFVIFAIGIFAFSLDDNTVVMDTGDVSIGNVMDKGKTGRRRGGRNVTYSFKLSSGETVVGNQNVTRRFYQAQSPNSPIKVFYRIENGKIESAIADNRKQIFRAKIFGAFFLSVFALILSMSIWGFYRHWKLNR